MNEKVTISQWILNDMIRKGLHLLKDLSHERAAKVYLGKIVGGHTHPTIGNSVIHTRYGYDCTSI